MCISCVFREGGEGTCFIFLRPLQICSDEAALADLLSKLFKELHGRAAVPATCRLFNKSSLLTNDPLVSMSVYTDSEATDLDWCTIYVKQFENS